jgi:hypothetical protein
MKKINIIFTVLLAVLIGCEKIEQLTQFDMEYNETVVIPSSAGMNLPIDLFTPDIESNAESTFAVNDTRKDLIEEIVLKQLDLTLTSPSDGDLGFLKSIEIYLSAEGLSDVKIAWKDDIPSDPGKYIELETTNTDLKEFIKKDEFALKVTTVTDELLSSDHHIDVHSVFFVDAKIIDQ